MSWPLAQVGLLVLMTHVVRAVGDRLGPRWGALVLGLPSTTAVLLVGGGCENGSLTAALGAEAAMLGLVASVAVPLAYAGAVGRGWGVPSAPLAALAVYVALAAMPRLAPDLGVVGGALVALAGVVAGCRLARRLPDSPGPSSAGTVARSLALRSAVPAAFVLLNRGLRAVAGPGWAATFATFPAMSLAVLVSLHLEGGPAPVCRLARSLPRGNLVMIAFLATFRLACVPLGPLGAAAAGYVAVLLTLTAVVATSPPLGLRSRRETPGSASLITPRSPRPFAPRIEAIAGC